MKNQQDQQLVSSLITFKGLFILSRAFLHHSTFSGFIGLALGLLINASACAFNVDKSLICSRRFRSSISKL